MINLVHSSPSGRNRRAHGRQFVGPANPEQHIAGNSNYFLHPLKPREVKARGMPHKTWELFVQAYPVVLGNEWLEELCCPNCGSRR